MMYWLTTIAITIVLLIIVKAIVSSGQYAARLESVRKAVRKLPGFQDADVLYGLFGDSCTAIAINEHSKEACFLRTGAQLPVRTGFVLQESFEVFHTSIPGSQIATCEIVEDGDVVSGLSNSSQWVSTEGRVLDAYGVAAELSRKSNTLNPTVSQLSLRITTTEPNIIVHEVMLFSGVSQPRNGSFYRKRFSDVYKWHFKINALMSPS